MAKITFSDILNKTILIGLTFYTPDNDFVRQEQYHGTVIEFDSKAILVKLSDGTIYKLPPDLSSTKAALPGEYRLNSTGEVVVNPVFLTTWIIVLPNDGE